MDLTKVAEANPLRKVRAWSSPTVLLLVAKVRSGNERLATALAHLGMALELPRVSLAAERPNALESAPSESARRATSLAHLPNGGDCYSTVKLPTNAVAKKATTACASPSSLTSPLLAKRRYMRQKKLLVTSVARSLWTMCHMIAPSDHKRRLVKSGYRFDRQCVQRGALVTSAGLSLSALYLR